MDGREPLLGQGGERLGEPSDAAEVAHRGPPSRTHVLDRRLEQPFEALLDELRHLRIHQLARNRQVPLRREPVEPDRRPPQPVGITRAGRPVPEPEGDVERVDLVRGRENAPGFGLRQRGVGSVGQVLLVDRGADRLGIPGEPRVLAADVALELRELPHQLGRLVRLREPRRLERRLAAAESLDELPQALRLVRERARSLEERDRAQPLGQVVDPDLDVALERERRVLEAALDDVLDPGSHGVRVAAVRDEGEAVLAERKRADVVLDRRLDDPARQLQVALVEPAFDHDRLLDEEDDLAQDAVRVGPAAEIVQRVDDLLAPLQRVGLDVGLAQRVEVRRGVRDVDLAGREAMPVGALADDLGRVDQRERPANRPRKANSVAVPAHRLREGEPADDPVDLPRQDLRERLPARLRRRGSRRAPRAPPPQHRGASRSPQPPSPASPPVGP